MKNIKISTLDEKSILELENTDEAITIFIDDQGTTKDKLMVLNDLLEKKENVTVNISSSNISTDKNHIVGINLLKYILSVRNLDFYSSINSRLSHLKDFSKLIHIRRLRLYGELERDISFLPLDPLEELESIYIDNGLTLKQDVYLERRETLREIGASLFRMESFSKNPNIVKIAILSSVTCPDMIYKKLPNLKSIYIEKGNGINNFSFLNTIKTLEEIELNDIKSLTSIPDLSSLNNLEKVVLKNLRNLDNIDYIINNKNIKILVIENIKCKINIEELYNMERLKYINIITDDKLYDKNVANALGNLGYQKY